MNLYRLIAVPALAFLLAEGAFAADGIAVVKKDGSQTEVSFERLDRLDIGKDGITVRNADGTSADIPYAELSKVLIGVATTSASLPDAAAFAVYPTRTTGNVYVAGLPQGTTVSACSTAGVVAASTSAGSDGNAVLNLAQAPSGIYLVSAAGKTVKIVKE